MSDDMIRMVSETLNAFRQETNDRMGRIEVDLREHKEGVIQNRTRIEHLERHEMSNESRINKLEDPGKALRLIKQWAGWVLAVGAALALLGEYL